MFTDNLYLRSNPLIYKSRADYQKVSHHFSNNHVVVECSVFGVSNQVSVINKVDHQWSLFWVERDCCVGVDQRVSGNESCRYQDQTCVYPEIVDNDYLWELYCHPISHYMYFIINNKIFKGPLTKSGKILQILTSLSTVTPTLAACFVSWIALINNYKLPKGSINPIAELNKIVAIVRAGLKKGYFGVLKSSLVTSSVALVIAQKFVPPELWVVFFNVVYFSWALTKTRS